jgi:hypothetical protein
MAEDEVAGGGRIMTRKQAEQAARDLVRRLGGPPWHPQVWEDYSWCYGAGNGLLKVYPSLGRFYCVVETTEGPEGRVVFRAMDYLDPKEAMRAAVEKGREWVRNERAFIDKVEAACRAAGTGDGNKGDAP